MKTDRIWMKRYRKDSESGFPVFHGGQGASVLETSWKETGRSIWLLVFFKGGVRSYLNFKNKKLESKTGGSSLRLSPSMSGMTLASTSRTVLAYLLPRSKARVLASSR